MALTGSAEINKYAINKYSKQFGENGAFRLLTIDEMKDDGVFPKEGLFSNFDDYNSLTTVTRKYPSIQEIELKDQSHYESLIEITTADKDIIPLFIKDNKGDLQIIPSDNKKMKIEGPGWYLVYLGKPFDVENTETV